MGNLHISYLKGVLQFWKCCGKSWASHGRVFTLSFGSHNVQAAVLSRGMICLTSRYLQQSKMPVDLWTCFQKYSLVTHLEKVEFPQCVCVCVCVLLLKNQTHICYLLYKKGGGIDITISLPLFIHCFYGGKQLIIRRSKSCQRIPLIPYTFISVYTIKRKLRLTGTVRSKSLPKSIHPQVKITTALLQCCVFLHIL